MAEPSDDEDGDLRAHQWLPHPAKEALRSTPRWREEVPQPKGKQPSETGQPQAHIDRFDTLVRTPTNTKDALLVGCRTFRAKAGSVSPRVRYPSGRYRDKRLPAVYLLSSAGA
jgi:hypothetical protein